jgi:tol-pal system protein YbgF
MRTSAGRKGVALATLLLAGGCLSAENSERRQLASLEKGIESDRFAVDHKTPRVEEKEDPKPAPAASPVAVAGPMGVRAIEGDDPADTTPRTVIRMYGKNAPSVQVVAGGVPAKEAAPSAAQATPGSAAPSAEAQHAYDGALGLVNAHAYDKGAGALGVFLLQFPDDPNASNAMYWQAECYFAMGEYAHASELFEQTADRFPKSTRVPDCLLKLGLCQEKLGDEAKAKSYFQRLGSEYPKSEAARRIPAGT